MASGKTQTKALACRATRDQELITKGQLKIIRHFLSVGNENSSLVRYVIINTDQTKEMWNQTLIFLALVSFRPIDTKIPPPLRIDEMWHKFILCTREYTEFCEKTTGRYLHHVPNPLYSGEERSSWFGDNDWELLSAFLSNQVPEYDETLWFDPGGMCAMCKD